MASLTFADLHERIADLWDATFEELTIARLWDERQESQTLEENRLRRYRAQGHEVRFPFGAFATHLHEA